MSSSPWIVLGISLVIVTLVSYAFFDLDNQAQKVAFESLLQSNVEHIENELKNHEQMLWGFEGLFASYPDVRPEEFETFFYSQRIVEPHPDIQGISYNPYISGETEKNELVKKLSEYGMEFAIHPPGTRETYLPVMYLQPMDDRNIRAIGFDIYSEEIRRQAIEQAKDSGEVSITKKITLVQETDEDIQNGFLMLLPVYEGGDTKDGKIQGFVVGVFRMNDFIEEISDEGFFDTVSMKIYDGAPEPENLFFDSNNAELIQSRPGYSESLMINFGGNQWYLEFYGKAPESAASQIWLIVPIIGYAMSFVLFYLLVLYSRNIDLTKKSVEKEKITSVGQLASRFAHDIRNPLSNIRLSMILLEEEKTLESKEGKENFQSIKNNLERISHQIDDVLDFVKVHPLKKTSQSLNSAISEAIKGLNVPKNIKINTPSNTVQVKADFNQLNIVFKNLITNAIQAIGTKQGVISIRLEQDSKHVIIEIEDSGPGFVDIDESKILNRLSHQNKKEQGWVWLAASK